MSKLKVENSMHYLFIPIQYSFMQWSWHRSIFFRALLGWLKNGNSDFKKSHWTFFCPDKSKLRCDRCVRRWLRRCVREWVRGWGVNCGKIGLRRLLTACSSHNSSHYFSFSIFFAVSCLKTSFLISFCLPSSCLTFHRLILFFSFFPFKCYNRVEGKVDAIFQGY